mmetsp:Transcript_3867/g.4454  ORF Transcript_3867/g.4454 Transcript_3867/m.4454 type:complete len:164 (+) Transcript_3867:340-831(+)
MHVGIAKDHTGEVYENSSSDSVSKKRSVQLCQNPHPLKKRRVWEFNGFRKHLQTSENHDASDINNREALLPKKEILECFVKTLNGKTIKVQVGYSKSVSIHLKDIKESLEEQTGTQYRQARILFNKKVVGLDDDLSVPSGSVLQLISQVGGQDQYLDHYWSSR